MAEKNWVTISKSNQIQLRARKIKSGYSLVLDIHYKNKRYYETLKLYLATVEKKKMTVNDKKALQQAEYIKAQRIMEMTTGDFSVSTSKVLESDSVVDFFSSLVKQKEGTGSFYKWRSACKKFSYFFSKGILFNELTPKKLEKYQSYLLEDLKKSNTAHTYMSVLSSVLNIAIRDEIINTNPLSKIKRVQWKEPELKFLTVEEVRKLHESHCKYPEIKRAFLFSCFTGLRLSDIENLKWDQIYNDREKLYVQLVQKKTTEPVRIYLAKQAAEYLYEQNRGDVYVFMLLDRRHTQRKLKEWLKSIQGIKSNISFHSARHTFATMTLTYGAGLKTVSELLGHKSIKVTERYAKVIDKLKEEAVNNLPDF